MIFGLLIRTAGMLLGLATLVTMEVLSLNTAMLIVAAAVGVRVTGWRLSTRIAAVVGWLLAATGATLFVVDK